MSSRFLFRLLLTATALLLTACPSETQSPIPSSPTSAGPTTEPPEPDPLVPYSPSPTPFQEVTWGFLGETLTLPTIDGGKLYVTFDRTALTTTFVDGARSLSVWVTVHNPGESPWSGVPGAKARIVDLVPNTFSPVAPTAADLHPHPEKYDAVNFDLQQEVTIAPGDSVQGVIVFRPPGGNRSMTLGISFDDGATWGEWQMNLGPF